MADSAIWRTLGEKFRVIVDAPDGMRTRWTLTSETPTPYFEILYAANSESRMHFFNLARLAGHELDTNAPDPFTTWMMKLRETRPNHDFNKTTYDSNYGDWLQRNSLHLFGNTGVRKSLRRT